MSTVVMIKRKFTSLNCYNLWYIVGSRSVFHVLVIFKVIPFFCVCVLILPSLVLSIH